MRILTKIIRGILLTFLSALLLLNGWQFISRFVFGQSLPAVCGYSPVIVLSGSMEPAFSAGDLLIIRKQDSYQKDDIITFEDGGALTTHRIIEQSLEGFITKGDHNNVQDGKTVSLEQIHGAVVLVLPALGSFFLFLRSPLGILSLVALCLLAVFLPGGVKKLLSHRKGCAG